MIARSLTIHEPDGLVGSTMGGKLPLVPIWHDTHSKVIALSILFKCFS